MGGTSIIARRLNNDIVQFGWSGNDGYYRNVGDTLLKHYNDETLVAYLFSLGQLMHIGLPGSEKGGYGLLQSHILTGTPHSIGTSERSIFSDIAFVSCGYFWDDKEWYYIIPGPFRIKMSLELIKNNLDERGSEFAFRDAVERQVLEYILLKYPETDPDFAQLMSTYNTEQLLDELNKSITPADLLFVRYNRIYKYLDDWVVINPNSECTKIESIIVRPRTGERIETIFWKNPEESRRGDETR